MKTRIYSISLVTIFCIMFLVGCAPNGGKPQEEYVPPVQYDNGYIAPENHT